MNLIDSHTHLDMSAFDEDRAEVVERSRALGATRWVIPALSERTAGALLNAEWRTKEMYVCAGFHPHEVDAADESRLDDLEDMIKSFPEIVAIGETGLDYHYGLSSAPKQRIFLERQIEMAERHAKPLVLHIRDGEERSAYDEILEIIRGSTARGVLHSFTGPRAIAEEATALGWYLGMNGIATFKKSDELRATFQSISKECILLETDAPYLAPVPYRGKRNEPSYLVEVARSYSALINLEINELALLITRNTESLFQLPQA